MKEEENLPLYMAIICPICANVILFFSVWSLEDRFRGYVIFLLFGLCSLYIYCFDKGKWKKKKKKKKKK